MDESLQGRVLDGKYRLTRPLGEGGMGVVWAATHTALGREFAVKLLRTEFAKDPQALIRFQQEAVAVSKVGSPHLVALTDFGTTVEGAPYIVMELLAGQTLEAAMRAEQPMAVSRIVDILCQVLTALAEVHAQGIVHRDLKPANVFLTRLGERQDFVKLLDFGVAKVLGGDQISHFTRTGTLLGTPTYMSPEQVQGGQGVDHRTDLWAVGVILFRALTGRRPHDAPSRGERLAAIATQDVPPLRRFRPELDEELEAVLRRALTRELGRRFASALEFRAALEPFRGGIPSAYATSIAPPRPAVSEARLGAIPSLPQIAGRPTAPASPDRPTVGPGPVETTKRDGVAAADAPREFSLEPTLASGPPGSAAAAAVPSEAPGDPGGRPSGTATAEPSITTAAGLRRRPGLLAALGLAVLAAVVTVIVWWSARSEDGAGAGPSDSRLAVAPRATDATVVVPSAPDAGPATALPADVTEVVEPLDPELRARYLRAQTQVTCWQYYRMYGHPKSPAWDATNDVFEACRAVELSFLEWRRVIDSLTPDELLAAASEATRAAVPCITEASGLSVSQVQSAVPTIAGHQASALAFPPPPPPRRDAGGTTDDERERYVAVKVEQQCLAARRAGGGAEAPAWPAAEDLSRALAAAGLTQATWVRLERALGEDGELFNEISRRAVACAAGSGSATPPPPPPPPPPPLLDAAPPSDEPDGGAPDVAEPADAGGVPAPDEPDAAPPVVRSMDAGSPTPPLLPGELPGGGDGGGTKDVREVSTRELRSRRGGSSHD